MSEVRVLADLCFLPAVELARMIRAREVSACEVMQAHLARTAAVNPQLNAIVTLVADAALSEAQRSDAALSRQDRVGPLHGLPVAHKDLVLTKGIRTTFGSPVFASFVPDENSLIVDRLHAAGAITVGKTNTPEFGAGSQTFNAVFGVTRNPWNLEKTCGGSSGGAAVALATGMVPLAAMGPTWAGHSGIPRVSVTWSAFVHHPVECRSGLVEPAGFPVHP